MSRDILEKRDSILPEEYPEFLKYVDAINNSYWVHSKWNFKADINDYENVLDEKEKSVVKNSLLCISQVEIKVKRFWADIYHKFQKPEIDAVGVTFAESEVRHQRAYRRLIELLGIESEFEKLETVPQVKGRINYLSKYLSHSKSKDITKYAVSLALFALLIENSSLFGQFSSIKVMAEQRNVLKDIDNVIIDTTKEENIHALFGIHLIKILQEEHPELFDDDFYPRLKEACLKSYDAEVKLLDFIFEKGDLDYLSREDVAEYIKKRINYSLSLLDVEPLFELDQERLAKFETFEVEQASTSHVDFFHKKNPNYNKFSREINSEDLF